MPWRPIVVFLVKAIVLYAVLTAAWPLVDGVYQAMFRFGGSMVVPSYGPGVTIRFQPLPEADKYVDTLVHIQNKRNGGASRMKLSARYLGYTPTAILIALVIATPLTWRRRGRALLWGLPIVCVLVALRILLHVCEDLDTIRVIQVDGFLESVMNLARNAVSRSTFTWYVMPVVVWILVAFRRGDWAALGGEPEDQDT
ncbi:MAG: hypothetical protein HKO59_01340 [Phycisphaerales bacterium]|nr:hypothetical protein [Phycisphaerae bacterium]NNF43442.1 hypothetical protein [Phycisphaerales bacterium]NNM24624.1 hypothetical protein [Phycisphaerales bacterium]